MKRTLNSWNFKSFIVLVAFFWAAISVALAQNPNLVVNGDFEQTSGFDYQNISDYERVWSGGVQEGKFIHDNTSTGHGVGSLGWPANLGGYGGSGYYLLFNGFGGSQNPTKRVWWQQVNVTTQTTYTFKCYVRNLSQSSWLFTANPSILQVKINGSPAGSTVTLDINSYNWVEITRTWNSGNISGPINIEIFDVYTGNPDSGDDFGLDHISFIPNVLYDVNAQDDYVSNALCLNDYVDVDVLQNDNVLPNTNDAQVQVLTNPVPHGTAQVLSNKKIRYTFTDANYNGEVQFNYRVTNHGVVSEATVHVNTARPPELSNINLPSAIDICEGESLTLPTPTVSSNGSSITSQGWKVKVNGNWQNVSGNTIPSITTGHTQIWYNATNQCGGDDFYANLNVHEVEEETFSVVDCDSYTWHGTTYTQSGIYDYQTTTQWGCERNEHLNLTIYYSEEESYDVSACESYTWHGQTYTQSGTYPYNTTTVHGCDRTEWLNLNISTQYREVEPRTECDSYYWPRKQQWYYASALDSVSVSGPPGGCDSTFVLNLTIHYSQTLDPEIVESCDSYYWNGQTYTEGGFYTYETTNEYGCELIHQLQLTIHESEYIDLQPITACDSYVWHGQTYTESGIAVFDTINQFGCNVHYQLPLTINYSDTYDWDPVTECDSYFWYGQNITETGQYTHMSTTPEGCDRLERIYVTINHSVIDTLPQVTSCDSYLWHGQTYTQTGYYTYETTGPTGCPYTEVVLLTINHSSEYEFNVTACESYEWYGTTITEPGEYYHTLTNTQGCDSLLIMHLEIGGTFEFEESMTGCESFEWHGQTYYESGDYEYFVVNPNGCDSLFILHLTIAPNYETEMEAESCYTYTWIDDIYQESGDYTKIFTTTTGCDSLVTLHLTIKEAVYHEFEQQTCLPYTWNGVDYYYEGTYEQVFDAANGCDSIATMHLVESDAMTSEFDRVSCTAITWENQICNQSGDYTHTYESQQGCDSIVTMHFTLAETIVHEFDTLACEAFEWYGDLCSESGRIYSHTFQTLQGCDSIVKMHLTLNVMQMYTQFVTACDSIEMNGTIYNQPGEYYVYLDTLYTQNGCDSIIHRVNLFISNSDQIGMIGGSHNVYVASNLISGIYRYDIDTTGIVGDVSWSLSNPDWQIIETQIGYCRIAVTTPGEAILKANFQTSSCGAMERRFEIQAGFFAVEEHGVEANVYPNPTKGIVTIEAEGIESVRLTNMMGQTLDRVECDRSNSSTLNLNNFPPSVYLLEIETINGMVKRRVVVCR